MDSGLACLRAGTIVVNHAVRADWCAHIALSDDKTGWTLRVPLVLTLLALAALLFLAVSTPQREGFLAAKLCHLEELGASEVVLVGQHHQIILIKRLVIGRSSFTLSLLSLLDVLEVSFLNFVGS